MVLYINCASHAPGVKFGHVPGVDSLHRLAIGKTKKIFFSQTTRPTALIFGMCHISGPKRLRSLFIGLIEPGNLTLGVTSLVKMLNIDNLQLKCLPCCVLFDMVSRSG